MIEFTQKVTLKDGEEVDFSILRAPDAEWAPVLMDLVAHKGPAWDWQIEQTLTRDLGIEVYFYFLHRGRKAFSSVTCAELNGIGVFGHVWTEPTERRRGACAVIMERQMGHFRKRGGRYLSLGTGFDTPPFHIYRNFGFEGVEANNGYMQYSTQPLAEFLEEYFAPGPSVIEPFGWKHYPTSATLFLTKVPGALRLAPLRMIGLASTESPTLPVIMELEREENPVCRASALVSEVNGACTGMAVWGYHQFWPGTVTLDVFCHPNFWDRGVDLLASLKPPEGERQVAYADPLCPQKAETLIASGFRQVAVLPNWIRVGWSDDRRTDVSVFARS